LSSPFESIPGAVGSPPLHYGNPLGEQKRLAAGDAVDVLPELAAGLPAGEPRLVFHAATRIHVPRERRAAFDAAIQAVGATGPLWHLSVEGAPQPDPRSSPTRYGAGLQLRDPAGDTRTVAVVDGHLRWIETLDEVAR